MRSTSTPGHKASLAMLLILLMLTLNIPSFSQRTGQVRQGLVEGTLVGAAEQEKYTLVTLSTGCSGSLLRNNWIVTASHCVDNADPKNKGAFITLPEDSVTITAAWATEQSRQSIRIITFRPNDVAIIRVDMPFTVNGSTRTFIRDIFRDGQFPYFGQLSPVPIKAYGRGIYQFARISDTQALASQQDNQFRSANFNTSRDSGGVYWYANSNGQTIAGGDSGGPSFATVRGTDEVLMGVHSSCKIKCAPGKICGEWPGPGPAPATYSNWMWVIDTPECADAAIAPNWEEINRYLGAYTPEPPPPDPQFIGTFAKTPPNYQPMWVYAIKNDGDMMWYRKDTGASPWQGPKKVGNGWIFKDVIPAGGNSFYALTEDGKLIWYRHDGFNDGSRTWPAQVEVGHGWTFKQIFSGGEGIVYAIKENGDLVWYRHGGYADGNSSAAAWTGPTSIGTGWNGFKDVFSNGKGQIYAVTPSGELLFYFHSGYAAGEPRFLNPKTIATGWQNFRQIIPAGDGVILAVKDDGKLLWFRHYFKAENGFARMKEHWEGPIEIGSGWTGFKKIVALLPVVSAPVVR